MVASLPRLNSLESGLLTQRSQDVSGMRLNGVRRPLKAQEVLAALLLVVLLVQHIATRQLCGGEHGKDGRTCPTVVDLFRVLGPGSQQGAEQRDLFLEDGMFIPREPATIMCAPPEPEVHVQYSTDPTEYIAMLASVHSALRNAADPGRLRFHLTIPEWADERELCLRLLGGLDRKSPGFICPAASVQSYAPPGTSIRQCMAQQQQQQPASSGALGDSCFCGSPQFHIVRFNASSYDLPKQEAMGGHRNDRATLLAPINFARNFADSYLLPRGVRKVIYLDADTIVQGDLALLWDNTTLGEGQVAAVARSCKITMQQLYDFKREVVKASMHRSQCYINAGVYLLDLDKYHKLGIQRRISELIQMHTRERLWLQGVQQPSFVLAIVTRSVDIDPRWNQDSLGYNPKKKRLPPGTLRAAYVLHWNGVYKPWTCARGVDCYQLYWEPYRLE